MEDGLDFALVAVEEGEEILGCYEGGEFALSQVAPLVAGAETVAHGDLTRIRHRPTWANGRPAVTIELRAEDGTWIAHGISVLEIEDGKIVGIDAYLDPALVPRFGVSIASSP